MIRLAHSQHSINVYTRKINAKGNLLIFSFQNLLGRSYFLGWWYVLALCSGTMPSILYIVSNLKIFQQPYGKRLSPQTEALIGLRMSKRTKLTQLACRNLRLNPAPRPRLSGLSPFSTASCPYCLSQPCQWGPLPPPWLCCPWPLLWAPAANA